jgi:8-amino-7-oxononanoate synthase
MGSYGAYVACSKTMRDYLVNRCAGLIYSTALPPQVLGAIDASLDILPGLDAERAHVAGLAAHFRDGARALGLDTGASATQIVPVIVGESDAALALSARLKGSAYWATAIRPPTVPEGTARLRLAFSAAHTSRQVDDLLETLAETKAGQHVNTA